jgi:hypothetical protein
MEVQTMQSFSRYSDFKAAALAAGLTIRSYCDSENGPSADDLDEPVFASDADRADYGIFLPDPLTGGEGWLCATPEAFEEAYYRMMIEAETENDPSFGGGL